MKIEHWIARNAGPDEHLENDDHHFLWSNLLGVCPRVSLEPNTRENRNVPHCDTSRGNARLFLHPVDGQGPDPRAHLKYTTDGHVVPSVQNELVDNDIETLNLNAVPLVRAREATFYEAWKDLKKTNFAIGDLRRLEQRLRIIPGVQQRAHAEFLRYHVCKKIRQKGHSI